MTVLEAIETLDKVIPPPYSKMVDLEHFRIATAWETIRKTLLKEGKCGDNGNTDERPNKKETGFN